MPINTKTRASKPSSIPTSEPRFAPTILTHLFPGDPSFAPHYEMLAQKLSGPSRQYTTQELAWGSVLELSTAIRASRRQGVTLARWPESASSAAAKEQLQVQPPGQEQPSPNLILENESETALTALIVQDGIVDIDALKTGSESISVSRTLLDETGDTIDPERLQLGQLIYAKVEIETCQNTTTTHCPSGSASRRLGT